MTGNANTKPVIKSLGDGCAF